MAYLKDKLPEVSPVVADPYTLEALIAWLEKQPASKEYDYYDCDGLCLFGQYGTAIGLARPMDAWDWICDRDDATGLNWAGDIAARAPTTFGAALQRARSAHEAERERCR